MRLASALRTWPPSCDASDNELRSCGREPRRAGDAELPEPRRPPMDGRRAGELLRPPIEARRCFGDGVRPPMDARRCLGDALRPPMDARRCFGDDPWLLMDFRRAFTAGELPPMDARRARFPDAALPNDERRTLDPESRLPPPKDERRCRGDDAALLMDTRRAMAGIDTSLVFTVNDGRLVCEWCDPCDDLEARRASCKAPSMEPRRAFTFANDGLRPSPPFMDSRRCFACCITSSARLAATACCLRRAALCR